MVAMSHIKEFGHKIGREFNAERVILFGSYAEGSATEDSDVDLLIIIPFKGRSVDQSVKIRMKLRPPNPRTTTAFVFIVNNVRKNILKPASVKLIFHLAKYTTLWLCLRKFLQLSRNGKSFVRTLPIFPILQ